MTAFRFHNPWWLWALVLLVPLVFRLLLRRRRSAVLYSSLTVFGPIAPTWRARLRPLVPWLRMVGLACLVVALARPQEGIEGFRVRKEGITIQICLDRSTSMSAEDFQLDGNLVSRLRAVKAVIRKFVNGDPEAGLKGRPDDQIGLVAFGGFAEVRCPPTLDHKVFESILEAVNLPDPPRNTDGSVIQAGYELYRQEGATAIGDALALSVDQLRKSDAKSKVIILLSDGEHNAGVLSPAQAIEIAKQFDVRVYAIGVGSTGRRFIRVVDRFGTLQYQPMLLTLDEDTLTTIADETGGKYFNASDTAALLQVYRDIDRLEKTSTEGAVYREYREMCRPWLVAALLLVTCEIVLMATVFRGVT